MQPHSLSGEYGFFILLVEHIVDKKIIQLYCNPLKYYTHLRHGFS